MLSKFTSLSVGSFNQTLWTIQRSQSPCPCMQVDNQYATSQDHIKRVGKNSRARHVRCNMCWWVEKADHVSVADSHSPGLW
eukprot:5054528-Amphidinium_carterae.1